VAVTVCQLPEAEPLVPARQLLAAEGQAVAVHLLPVHLQLHLAAVVEHLLGVADHHDESKKFQISRT